MANYIIIGGDNKEYGPVTDTDVRQWISEGRLNAESRVKAESDAEFRPLAAFPEFAAALGAHGAPATISPPADPMDFLERDYELDIGDCISQGWGLLKDNFGTIFGAFVIVLLIQIGCGIVIGGIGGLLGPALTSAPAIFKVAFNYLSSLVLAPVVGPLMGGLFFVYLKTIRGEATGAGEVFAGFQRAFLHLFLGSLMVSLITGACWLPFQYVWEAKAGPLLEQMSHGGSDPTAAQKVFPQLLSAFGSSLPVFCVCMLPLTFFVVCFQFTLPLIVDKAMDFGTAMKTSMRMVMKHWWVLFGFTVVVGLVTVLGLLGCCIGIIFTVPIGLAAMMFAYETIFGARKN